MSTAQLIVLSIVIMLCGGASVHAHYTGQITELGIFMMMAAWVFWFILGDAPILFRAPRRDDNLYYDNVD